MEVSILTLQTNPRTFVFETKLKEMREAFDASDVNKDGRLNRSELMKFGLRMFGKVCLADFRVEKLVSSFSPSFCYLLTNWSSSAISGS